jgi:hypothetical protein
MKRTGVLFFILFMSFWGISQNYYDWGELSTKSDYYRFLTKSTKSYDNKTITSPLSVWNDIDAIYVVDQNFNPLPSDRAAEMAFKFEQLLQYRTQEIEFSDQILERDLMKYENTDYELWIPTGSFGEVDPRFLAFIENHVIGGPGWQLNDVARRKKVYGNVILNSIIPESGIFFDQMERIKDIFPEYDRRFEEGWNKYGNDIVNPSTFLKFFDYVFSFVDEIQDKNKTLQYFDTSITFFNSFLDITGILFDSAKLYKEVWKKAMDIQLTTMYLDAEAQARLDAWNYFINENLYFLDPVIQQAFEEIVEPEFEEYANYQKNIWKDAIVETVKWDDYVGMLNTVVSLSIEYSKYIPVGAKLIKLKTGCFYVDVALIVYDAYTVLHDEYELLQAISVAGTFERILQSYLTDYEVTDIYKASYVSYLENIRSFLAVFFYNNFSEQLNDWQTQWIADLFGGSQRQEYIDELEIWKDKKLSVFLQYRPDLYPLGNFRLEWIKSKISNLQQKEPLQVALSIDRSGSMHYNGYMDLAKKASTDFLNMMEIGDYLAVTSFSNDAYVDFPFTQLVSEKERSDAIGAINLMYPINMTSMGDGLQAAQTELEKGNTNIPQGIVLLSDGYDNYPLRVEDVLPNIPGKTDIYTISLGSDSDENLLNRIAAETGGFYSYAPSENRLSLIYNTIKSKVSGQQTVALKSGQIALNETLEHQVYIDQGAVLFEGVITWPGSDLDLEIIDPLGNVIGHNSNLSNVIFREGPTFEKYRILNPIPGLYTFRITGVDISGLTEPYTLSISTESTLEMNVEFDKEVYGIYDPILVSANINDGGTPVTGANVTAKVTSPSSLLTKSASADELAKKEIHDLKDQGIYEEESIILKSASTAEAFVESDLILYDDGLHGDGAADDGIYANYYSETSAVGSYIFDVTASGTAPSSGDFSRFESKSTVVTDQKTIVVSEPQAGTVWSVGSDNVVKWSSTNIDGNVNIYLSVDGGSTYPIELAMDTPDDGEELIKLPATPSTTCRVKVESIAYPSVIGFNSGNFTLECDEKPSVLAYIGETTVQYLDEIALSAQLTDESFGVGIEGEEILFTIGTQSAKATTDVDGIASTTLTLTQDPCNMNLWEIQMDFAGSCANAATTNMEALDYMPEKAHIEYTGTTISATKSVRSYDFTVTLRAVIWDDMDGFPGNISNAHARFVIGGEPIVTANTDDDGYIPVKLLMDGDESVGMIETDWSSTLKDNPTTFDVKVELMNCYYKGISFDNPLTVYNSVGDFITGGGHLAINSSADGAYAPMANSKLNFGFNVRINKNGKNLIGKMNIVYRRMEADGLHTYQIKSNATTSLGTNTIDESTKIAEFVSKANLTDVTVLDDYGNGVEVAGNLTLHVTMTDKGEPGDMDQIAFSLYNSDVVDPNALWFSNSWDGINTIEQLLDGGNLVVHSSAVLGDDSEETAEHPKNKNKSAIITSDNYTLKVYPNPFSEKVYFEITSMTDTNARLELFDAAGKKLIVLFDKDIKAKQINTVDYSPDNISTQMLFYRIIFDDEVINGKISYRK